MRGWITGLLRPPPDAPPIADPEEVRRRYRYWRLRIMYASLTGYALFYLVRKNLSMAQPEMLKEFGLVKADMGLVLTLHGLTYGLSKFANGYLGDRTNARWFLVLGLLLSISANLACGLAGSLAVFGLFWILNGWFQGMGFPPCARTLTHWFSPAERATKFSIWNTSHSIGAGLAVVLCGLLVPHGWRLAFFVPAAIALLGCLFLAERMRDRPQSLGLPPVEVYAGDAAEADDSTGGSDFNRFLIRNVFLNPMVWVVSVSNFFVYTVRYSVLDWGPTLMREAKHASLSTAGWTTASFEAAGILGMLASGWLTDRVFRGRAGRACFVYMVLCGGCLFAFWKMPPGSPWTGAALLGAAGFFIYGPQCLVGVMAANLATRRAAATAIGLTGLFGYLSGILSGWGLGKIVDTWGWDRGFQMMIAAAAVASVLFAFAWNAYRPDAAPDEGRA